MFLSTSVARFYVNNQDIYNKFDATKNFLDLCNTIKDDNNFLDELIIPASEDNVNPYVSP